MKTKYYNDAIIGNKEMLASYSKTGELLRLYYPTKDNRQFIDFFETGVTINDSNLIYTHDDINNIYRQKYVDNTNVLTTEITNTYFNLKIIQTDFVSIKSNLLIKRYVFKNENNIDLNVHFFIHSKLHSGENNFVSAKLLENGITQYSHDYAFNIFSNKLKVYSHQINDSANNIKSGKISDKDYIGMSSDSSICYEIGTIKPGEKKSMDILISINKNDESANLIQIDKAKKIDTIKEQASVISYWEKYLKMHDKINLKQPENVYEEKLQNIYKRSILLFPLLINQSTGGIIAAVEVDEERKKCGRYNYCWPRDAVFVTKALDILKMEKEAEKFYKVFCKNTQSENGMWEQRFYTDGTLAPCWGYQIDETASVIYGIYEHYKIVKDKKFLTDTLKMCEKAIKFLKKYVYNLLENKEEIHISYDLWEMHEGISLYSISSIFAAFESMGKIYDELYQDFESNRIKQENIRKEKQEYEELLVKIKKYILNNLYDNEKKSFVRNIEDKKMDISILGIVSPFNIFTAKEKNIINTVEKLDLTLRTYTGGYMRFEGDQYMGGNPWTIATLWMALYHIEKGEKKKAQEDLKFVITSATENGFIPEQVDNETLSPAWVIGLGWAHAMFILVLEKMSH